MNLSREENLERLRIKSRKSRERRISLIGRAAESRRQRNVYLNFAYKISLADYEKMLAGQRGRCAICAIPPRPDINTLVFSICGYNK